MMFRTCVILAIIGFRYAAPAWAGSLVGDMYACSTFGLTPAELADVGVTVISHFP